MATGIAPIIRIRAMERNKESIRTVGALNTFFALSTARQYRIASQDEELATFLINLNHSYESLDHARPGTPVSASVAK